MKSTKSWVLVPGVHCLYQSAHTFSVDNSGMLKTCLFQYKAIGSEHVFTSDITIIVFGWGSGEHKLTIHTVAT